MSTTVYLYCLDHTPYISGDEVEQHIGGAYSENIARFIAERDRLAKVDLWDDNLLQGSSKQFERNAAWFFQSHPKCRVGVKDEYGRWHDFPGAHVPDEASWAAGMVEATSDLDFGDLPREFREKLLGWCEDVSRWKRGRA